jgi:hypothetical protein
MTDEATLDTLSVEERLVVEQFRQRMADPDGQPSVSVVNESLGSTPQGEKIQFKPGPGKVPSPALPPGQRWAARERRRLEAQEAARSRGEKNRKSIVQQVENMKEKLVGRNVQDTARYIELLSPHDREIAALVEEATTARKSILQLPGMRVSGKVRDQYQAEQQILQDVASDA